MLKKLAIWYLRKKKVSVIIGHYLYEGILQSKNNTSYTYDCDFEDTMFLDKDCKAWSVPEGKFEFVDGVKKVGKKRLSFKFEVKPILLYLISLMAISLSWYGYEMVMFGEIKADAFDTLIAILMSISISINFLLWDYLNK